MTADVEMADVEGSADNKETDTEPKPATPVLKDVLAGNLKLLRKAVSTRESRLLFGRLLRQTATVRGQFCCESFKTFFDETLQAESSVKRFLMYFLTEEDQAAAANVPALDIGKDTPATSSQPEEEAFCCFLLCQLLVDKKHFGKLSTLTTAFVPSLRTASRRTLDVLAARIFFYFSLAHEHAGTLQSIRATLLELHCTAVLNHDEFGQEVLLNLLLRNYLHYNLYDQAEKLRAQAQRPETTRSNQQYSRYLFYLGRIRAVQLEYTEAKECLLQASRKAPMVAKAFNVCVTKWLMVIRLLLGEIPERLEFQHAGMGPALQPYLALTHAVRSGDVGAFNAVAQQHQDQFNKDKTFNLINRLRYNVIRAGLRRISIAYSRISLQDVALKLGLPSAKDTESVVAKTIRDGSISATIDHEARCLVSKAVADVYVTKEPQQAFHVRTAFCMDIHNEAVKAMRYDEPAEKEAPKVESSAGLTEAIAAAMAEEDEF